MEELGLIVDVVTTLAVALIGGVICHRLRLPVILGYLIAGIIIGPHVLGLVHDPESVETLATIGVVLLLFTLGLEFSFSRLTQMGKVAILGGIAQIVTTAGLGAGIGILMDWSVSEAIFFGFLIALSSTMIVLKTLMDRGELDTVHGRVMIGILLVQDLSVVPMLVILPSLGGVETSLLPTLGIALLKAAGFFGAMLALGIWLMPRAMRGIAGLRSRELFLLTVVIICLGTAFGTYYFGLSVALGAFVAGILLSESEYAHQALAEIIPLRDIFVTIFFVSLGMLADPGFVSRNIGAIAGVVAAIIIGKFIIAALIARLFGHSAKTNFLVGVGLSQIGEFSFVLAGVGLAAGVISGYLYSLTVISAIITMLLTPFALSLASMTYYWLSQRRLFARLTARSIDPDFIEKGKQLTNHVVICGHGRTGGILGRVLESRNFSYLVIDLDPTVIDSLHARGIPCIYGDASNPEILARGGVGRCKVLVITYPDLIATELTVRNALRINPKLDVVARVHSDSEAKALRKIGVAELVHPEFEAGLEIIRHTLHRFGMSTVEIQYIVNSLRDDWDGLDTGGRIDPLYPGKTWTDSMEPHGEVPGEGRH